MIRQRLELMVGFISDSLFNEIMFATKMDVLVNRVAFKQRTSFDSLIARAVIAYKVLSKCFDWCPRCDTKDISAMGNYCSNCGVKLNR